MECIGTVQQPAPAASVSTFSPLPTCTVGAQFSALTGPELQQLREHCYSRWRLSSLGQMKCSWLVGQAFCGFHVNDNAGQLVCRLCGTCRTLVTQ